MLSELSQSKGQTLNEVSEVLKFIASRIGQQRQGGDR